MVINKDRAAQNYLNRKAPIFQVKIVHHNTHIEYYRKILCCLLKKFSLNRRIFTKISIFSIRLEIIIHLCLL